VKAKRSLAERVSRCEGCGLVIDREVGATRLASWGAPPPGNWWRWIVSFLVLTGSQRGGALLRGTS
jgi:hypothetical protein